MVNGVGCMFRRCSLLNRLGRWEMRLLVYSDKSPTFVLCCSSKHGDTIDAEKAPQRSAASIEFGGVAERGGGGHHSIRMKRMVETELG